MNWDHVFPTLYEQRTTKSKRATLVSQKDRDRSCTVGYRVLHYQKQYSRRTGTKYFQRCRNREPRRASEPRRCFRKMEGCAEVRDERCDTRSCKNHQRLLAAAFIGPRVKLQTAEQCCLFYFIFHHASGLWR